MATGHPPGAVQRDRLAGDGIIRHGQQNQFGISDRFGQRSGAAPGQGQWCEQQTLRPAVQPDLDSLLTQGQTKTTAHPAGTDNQNGSVSHRRAD
jgi:hypothetical protein